MQIESLQRFVEVARAGSFYQAAKQAGTSAQSYAKALNSLEKDLGITLTIRNRSGVQLTAEGAVFFKFASSTVNALADCMEVIDGLSATDENGAPKTTVYATQYLMRLVALFFNDYDLISRFRWYEESFDKMLLRLERPNENDVYVAEVFSDEAFRQLDAKGIATTRYFRTVLGVLVRDDSPLASRKELSCEEVARMPLCLYPHRERNCHRGIVFRNCPLSNVIVESEGMYVLLQFVRNNMQHGCLTDSYMVHSMRRTNVDLTGLTFVPLAEKLASSYACLLHAKGCSPTAQVLRIINLFKDLPSAQLAQYMKEYPTMP